MRRCESILGWCYASAITLIYSLILGSGGSWVRCCSCRVTKDFDFLEMRLRQLLLRIRNKDGGTEVYASSTVLVVWDGGLPGYRRTSAFAIRTECRLGCTRYSRKQVLSFDGRYPPPGNQPVDVTDSDLILRFASLRRSADSNAAAVFAASAIAISRAKRN